MSDPSLYDEVVYPGRAFPQTHPNRLAAMATLFGLDAADPAGCRVLELGCGDGGNLLPMALSLPRASFVGVDNSAQAIARARAVAQALGVGNVRFELLGVEEYEPEPQSFDYVAAHGLYSWMPAPLRDRVLDLFAAALAPNGVGVRELQRAPGPQPPPGDARAARCSSSRASRSRGRGWRPAASCSTRSARCGRAARAWRRRSAARRGCSLAQGDALFFHDTLAPINHAPYFHEFAGQADAHGLRFLAEADFADMQTGGLPDELRVRVAAAEDAVPREQLVDFLRQQMFRQTLLCHAARPVDPVPHPRRAAGLAVAGPIESACDEATGRVTFTSCTARASRPITRARRRPDADRGGLARGRADRRARGRRRREDLDGGSWTCASRSWRAPGRSSCACTPTRPRSPRVPASGRA